MTKPLARAIVDFWAAIGDMPLPGDIAAIVQAVGRAMHSPAPQTVLNKSFANLRRMRPGCFDELREWLEQSEVRRSASHGGAHWAWSVWCDASRQIHNGVKASTAFGMNQNGRPPGGTFTRADDAAMYAAYQRRTIGGRLKDLLTTAATIYGARLDETIKSYVWARRLETDDLKSATEDGAKKRS